MATSALLAKALITFRRLRSDCENRGCAKDKQDERIPSHGRQAPSCANPPLDIRFVLSL
jgi:hypothetical protein